MEEKLYVIKMCDGCEFYDNFVKEEKVCDGEVMVIVNKNDVLE